MLTENVKYLIESVFKSYENNEPLVPHTIDNIETVRRILKISDPTVACKTTECVYQRDGKCKLSEINTRERLSINDCGECLSFSDDYDDLY